MKVLVVDDEPSVRRLLQRYLGDHGYEVAIAEGAHNMAADEVLLESAVKGSASLRFYGWTKATLSLGYFQPAQLRLLGTHINGCADKLFEGGE